MSLIAFKSVAKFFLDAHLAWNVHSGAEYGAYLQKLEAAGEPITITKLFPAPIPDERNAYVEVRDAIAKRPDFAEPEGEEPEWPLSEDEREFLRRATVDHDATFAAVVAAIDKPEAFDPELKPKSPLLSLLLPTLNPLRGLANVLAQDALLQADAERHDVALLRLASIEPVAKSAGAATSLVGALVATGIRALQANHVMQIAADLRIGTAPGEVSPEQVRKLIDSLMKDDAIEREWRSALSAERLFAIDTFEHIARAGVFDFNLNPLEETRANPVAAYVLRPFYLDNALFSTRALTEMIEASRGATSWGSVREWMRDYDQRVKRKLTSSRYLLARILMPSITRALETKYRGLTDRQLAATALAIRWYRIDHGGALPQRLDELVPKYMPAVPVDPMSAGEALRYRNDNSPMLWSVGVNGTDEGGDRSPMKPGQDRSGNRWQAMDVVVLLQPR